MKKKSIGLLNDPIDFWSHKDYISDNVYGISLEKWHNENIDKINNEVIVAVLDTQIDLNHEDLEGQLWINKSEIPNNNIDDDSNGYIDDINGWNFVGKPDGGYFIYGNFEYTRIIQKWDNIFKNKEKEDISKELYDVFEEYNYAKSYSEYYLSYYNNWRKSLSYKIETYPLAKDTLRYFFPNENYTLKDLDSLYQLYKTNDKSYRERVDNNDKDLGALIDCMIVCYEQNDKNLNDIIHTRIQMDSIIMQNLNIDFDDRKFIRDNPNILEKGYGNNIVNSFKDLQYHSTEVSSIIAANRKNDKGTKGFHDNIKIMPLSISVSGDEHDKDIAMAIYYAVDNGAKIINMSFGKEFSLNKIWVTNALKYAEDKNVLIVHCSGNLKKDIDKYSYYPDDYNYKEEKEVVDNFINVGSVSKREDSTMVTSFSNYGKNNVDIFAPGEEIYVAIPDNKYKYDSGTSLAAPMVSGTSALIWLYYPNLTVAEVKNIILESGVTVDKMVIKPGTKDEMVHFSELCKTGKILNTYNAMKMAEEVSKRKK
ncbi:S8 family serine peptidase [Flavobacterium sediminilitoris]|uniref:S8 family serine peptidase n=1 Tax=Flavobacterium sediminilitoris TaxID=2024526 RepID=A0ABY4HNS6_9FLAO|nr:MULTISPECIES: S8 family serine peptidase [Flavobacterium]UOX34515.1 S8 family serine peptidase [Flavobacterium sediminilitoris]